MSWIQREENVSKTRSGKHQKILPESQLRKRRKKRKKKKREGGGEEGRK